MRTDPVIAAVAFLVIAWLFMAITWPLSGDASVFAWIADTTLRGGRPYVDAWDTKGPGAWLPAMLMQTLTGRNSWSIRLFDATMLIVALVSLRSIARQLSISGSGRFAVALFAAWYCGLDYWNGAQPDGWVGVWLIAACALAMQDGSASRAAAGLLVRLSALVKPFYAGYMVVILILAASRSGSSASVRMRAVMTPTLGMALGIALLLGMLAMQDGLEGFLEVQRWNRDVYAGLGEPWLARVPETLRGALALPWGVVAAPVIYGIVAAPREQRALRWALALGWVGAALGAFLQGKMWPYHWLPMLPFYAILADIGLSTLAGREPDGEVRRFTLVMVGLAIATALLAPSQQLYSFAKSRLHTDARAAYERREFDYYGRAEGSLYSVVDRLAPRAGGGGDILVWTMHLAPAWLNGLKAATRFAVIRPLYDGIGSSFRTRYRSQFMTEIRTNPPRWWILPTRVLAERAPIVASQAIERFPEAERVLRARYRLIDRTPDWEVYELESD